MAPERRRQPEEELTELSLLLEFYPQLVRDIQELTNQFHELAEVVDHVQKNRTDAEKKKKSTKKNTILLGIGVIGLSLFIPKFGIAVALLGGAKAWKNTRDMKKEERKNVSSVEAAAKILQSIVIQLEGNMKEFLDKVAKIKTDCVKGEVQTALKIVKGIYKLVQDIKRLGEQAKSESGERLRQRAQELENMLEELQQAYRKLR